MRALTLHAPNDLRCEAVPDPAIERPDDVIVRVEVAGLCGSDLHPYRGREPGWDPGTVMGHEFVGEIVEAGPEVSDLGVGRRVVAPFTTSCGACFYCREGLTSRCEAGALFGWVAEGRGLQGAQAEFVRVPLAESTLAPVPEGVDPTVALLAGDVLATGLYAAEAGAVGFNEVVAILGCGPVGLMCVVACRERGAAGIFAVDSVPERLALAKSLGAEPVDLGRFDPVEVLRQATGGRGADVALEAVGSPAATRQAIDLLRPGGVLVAVGVHTEERFAFSPAELYDKNLTYHAGRCPARRMMEEALPLAASGIYPLGAIVTHRLPLAEGPAAYALFDHRQEGCVKVVFEP